MRCFISTTAFQLIECSCASPKDCLCTRHGTHQGTICMVQPASTASSSSLDTALILANVLYSAYAHGYLGRLYPGRPAHAYLAQPVPVPQNGTEIVSLRIGPILFISLNRNIRYTNSTNSCNLHRTKSRMKISLSLLSLPSL
jgi:hypothetical protein